MEDTKKPKETQKLGDLLLSVIDAQSKTISVMEKYAKLLQENAELKEKVLKFELQERDTIHIPPIKNGTVKTLELIEQSVK